MKFSKKLLSILLLSVLTLTIMEGKIIDEGKGIIDLGFNTMQITPL